MVMCLSQEKQKISHPLEVEPPVKIIDDITYSVFGKGLKRIDYYCVKVGKIYSSKVKKFHRDN